MKIVMLILHIVCVGLAAICAVRAVDMGKEIMWIVCSALWSVCVGIDIVRLIENI